MQKSVKEVKQIQTEVYTLLKAKNFEVKNLEQYNIVRGMNSKVIAEILYHLTDLKSVRNKEGAISIANLSDKVLLEIYNSLSERKEDSITPEAKLSLILTLIRYSTIFS